MREAEGGGEREREGGRSDHTVGSVDSVINVEFRRYCYLQLPPSPSPTLSLT